MQKDLHFNATLALCRRAGYSPEKARLVAWSNYQTDCTAQTQVKFPWQVWHPNPGPYFHFITDLPLAISTVKANSERVRALVKYAETPIQLGIALHAFLDSYSHQGYVGRLSKINQMGLFRRWLPRYGHTQMLDHPDRTEATWFDSRTLEVVENIDRFTDALKATYKFLSNQTSPIEILDILDVMFNSEYQIRKTKWARLAGLPDMRFSKIQAGMWKKHKKEFRQAAKRQKDFLTA